MTRLTPEDEKRMRVDDSCYSQPQYLALDRRILLAEIDALRAEIATFRNASPSLQPLNIKGHCAVCDRRSGRGTMTANDTFYCEKCIATRRAECLDLRKELGE